jgi:LacI family transcriptional regulator
MITMSMVALEAGVSLSTVSHVLNRTRKVADETVEAVLKAAERLGYLDHRLDTVKSTQGIVGVVVPSAASPYFGEMLDGIDAEATRTDVTLVLGLSGEDPGKEFRAVQVLLEHGVDALILVPSSGWRERTLPLLRHFDIPVVLADRLDEPSLDQVGAENLLASSTLVSHLLSLGHQRIGMVSGRSGLSTSRERVEGYRAAHSLRGLPVDESLIWEGGSTVKGGYAAYQALLKPDPGITGVFTANNNMTAGLLAALGQRGAVIPDDIAVVAFDDLEYGELVRPGLSCMAQPFHGMGSQALDLVLQRLQDRDREPQTIRLETYFEHRGSCGCRAG